MANINDRKQRISKMFKLSGQPFINTLLQEFRNGKEPFDSDFVIRNQLKEFRFNNHKYYVFKSTAPIQTNQKNLKILFIHGGGFVCEAGPQHYWFCEFISQNTGAEIWFPAYPIAPEHNGLEAIDMLKKIYEKMLTETSADNIIIMGDSAGGALSISLSMLLRDSSISQPKHIITISPAVDLLAQPDPDESTLYLQLIKSDDIVSPNSMPTIAKYWYGNLSPNDYRISPVHGDPKGLAPMTIFISKDEVCYLAYLHFIKNARKQNVDINCFEKDKVPHTWVVYPDFPAKEERKKIIALILH